jgi:ABC-type transport system involved in multi-copper enzyme maturation permease subunit
VINDIPDIDLSLKPILEFPDIWQNLTYIAGFFKIILALVLINSVNNEFVYGTARQNIIDGYSHKEWLFSKIALAKILALFSTLLIITIVLVLGFSEVVQGSLMEVLQRTDFALAYYIELVVYFIYALFFAIVLKRTGVSIILLLVYDFIFEPILSWSLPERLGGFLPMSTIDNLNTFPFTRYIGNDVAQGVSIEQLAWAISYGVIFTVLSYLIIKRRDL